MTIDTTTHLPRQIYEDLRQKIEEFEYKPGERLSEPTLAKHYGVSRTPIKQAITILEVDGIVHVRPSIGTFVSKIDTEHLEEFFTLRKLLEIGILEEFKQNFTDRDKKKLIDNLKRQDKLVEKYEETNKVQTSKKFWFLDNEFHKIIFSAVKKEYLWDLIVHNSLQANRFRVLSVSVNQEDLINRVKEHQILFEYITSDLELNVDDHYNNHLFNSLQTNVKQLKIEFPDYFD